MNYTTKEIERAVEYILGIGAKTEPKVKRPRGRQKKEEPKTWSLEFYNPENNRSFALISMCIKEDFDQSLTCLAFRLSRMKRRPVAECRRVLKRLSLCGKLGYYDSDRVFRSWSGEEASYGLESFGN